MKKSKKTKKRIRSHVNIKVIGVGGSGCATIDRMMKSKLSNIELIAINTDIQSLTHVSAHKKLRIGKSITKGLGTGMNIELGQQAAEASKKEIAEILRGADIVFIICGLGGGTGGGAVPIVAEIAKEMGILTIAIVTKPFLFEGSSRMILAEQALKFLTPKVDALVVVSNERILQVVDRSTSLLEAFGIVDEILKQTVKGISDIITVPGLINLDLAAVRAIMQNAGSALVGIGFGQGEGRAIQAAKMAVENPLLDLSIKGAQGILFIISGGPDITLAEINEIAKYITESADVSAKIFFGATIDENLVDQIKVTVLATGFTKKIISEEKDKSLESDKAVLIKPQISFKEKDNNQVHLEIKSEQQSTTKLTKLKTKEKVILEDELDIPAFLRKKKKIKGDADADNKFQK